MVKVMVESVNIVQLFFVLRHHLQSKGDCHAY